MVVRWDREFDLTVIELAQTPSARDVDLGRLIGVGLDADDQPVRVGLEMPQSEVTADDLDDLVAAYPAPHYRPSGAGASGGPPGTHGPPPRRTGVATRGVAAALGLTSGAPLLERTLCRVEIAPR